jgi:hypothetical protein
MFVWLLYLARKQEDVRKRFKTVIESGKQSSDGQRKLQVETSGGIKTGR